MRWLQPCSRRATTILAEGLHLDLDALWAHVDRRAP
jgi:hypothetical protein